MSVKNSSKVRFKSGERLTSDPTFSGRVFQSQEANNTKVGSPLAGLRVSKKNQIDRPERPVWIISYCMRRINTWCRTIQAFDFFVIKKNRN